MFTMACMLMLAITNMDMAMDVNTTAIIARNEDPNFQRIVWAKESVIEVNEVSETDNSREEADPMTFSIPCTTIRNEDIFGNWSDFETQRHIPATERYITTTRVCITTLTFDWLGQKRTVEDRKVLWTRTRKLVKKEEWVEE